MNCRVSPERLFEDVHDPKIHTGGYCHTAGWVVKRSLFERTGLFDENLRLHQDTAMFVKYSTMGRMVAGRLDEPVAFRRVHDNNRIFADRSAKQVYESDLLLWVTLYKWGIKNLIESRRRILLKQLIGLVTSPYEKSETYIIRRLKLRTFGQFASLAFLCPRVSAEPLYWRTVSSLVVVVVGSILGAMKSRYVFGRRKQD